MEFFWGGGETLKERKGRSIARRPTLETANARARLPIHSRTARKRPHTAGGLAGQNMRVHAVVGCMNRQ